jgi:hypothetical protein
LRADCENKEVLVEKDLSVLIRESCELADLCLRFAEGDVQGQIRKVRQIPASLKPLTVRLVIPKENALSGPAGTNYECVASILNAAETGHLRIENADHLVGSQTLRREN